MSRRPRADERLSAQRVVEAVIKHKSSGLFREPVPAALTEYHRCIARPRDLGTILAALEAGRACEWKECVYKTAAEVFLDVNIVWENCIAFNIGEESLDVRKQASDVRTAFQSKWRAAKLPEEIAVPPQPQWLAEDKVPGSLLVKRSESHCSASCADPYWQHCRLAWSPGCLDS